MSLAVVGMGEFVKLFTSITTRRVDRKAAAATSALDSIWKLVAWGVVNLHRDQPIFGHSEPQQFSDS
jgi:hypothetical protein